jgi:hypothetical protein
MLFGCESEKTYSMDKEVWSEIRADSGNLNYRVEIRMLVGVILSTEKIDFPHARLTNVRRFGGIRSVGS